jgi:hypothetical protein
LWWVSPNALIATLIVVGSISARPCSYAFSRSDDTARSRHPASLAHQNKTSARADKTGGLTVRHTVAVIAGS